MARGRTSVGPVLGPEIMPGLGPGVMPGVVPECFIGGNIDNQSKSLCDKRI
jgi:hypothetical protein